MKSIKPVKFYTETDEPLLTKENIRFYFEYKNSGDEAVESVPAEIIMGDMVRAVSLPGLDPEESKVIEMVLTNNMSDEVKAVGVRVGPNPEDEILRSFSWMGKVDLHISDLKHYEVMDTDKEAFYRFHVDNKGTKRAFDVEVTIEKDNEHYGHTVIKELAPKTSTPINIGMNRKLKGLFKIAVNAQVKMKGQTSASRTFHVEMKSQ